MRLPFIEAGEIVNTHGVRGEIKMLPWLDSPEDMRGFTRCRIGGKDYAIVSCRVQNTCDLLKLEGVDTMEAAQALRGKTVTLYREDMDEDVIFAGDLIGMEVFSQAERIGELTQVLDYPAVKEFILSTDLEGNRMEVKLLEGMETDAD